MKISTKGRYALRMLLDLAEHRQCGYIALKDIAERQNISKKYLEQIIPMFNNSGILKTSRGAQGGYQLAKSPDSYTLGEILRLTEGSRRRFCAPSRSRPTARAARTARASGLAGTLPHGVRVFGRHHAANAAGPAGGAPHQRLHDLNSERRRRSPVQRRNAGGRLYSANIGVER